MTAADMESNETQWHVAILPSSKQESHDVYLTWLAHICPQRTIIFFSSIWILDRELFWKCWQSFQISKKCPKVEFFFDVKLDALRGINSFIQLHAEHPRLSNSEDIWHNWLPQFSFMDCILRNFAPNYWTLHSPNIHYYFSPPCLCAWHFTHQKMSSPSFHLFKHYPSLKTQTKATPDKVSLIVSVWNDLSIFWTPTTVSVVETTSFKNAPYFHKYQKELWQRFYHFPKSLLPPLKE